MSGEKDHVVNLRNSEYQRLMNGCKEAERQASINKRMETEAAKTRSELCGLASAHSAKFAEYESRIKDASEQLRSNERVFNQRLTAQAETFARNVAGINQRLDGQRAEYVQLIAEQGECIEELRDELQEQISSLQQSIEAKEASQQRIAAVWQKDVTVMLDAIASSYQHEKFAPGAISGLKAQISLSQGNMASGNFQAAIAASQQTFLRAQELRLQLERKTLEWQAILTAATGSLREALVHMETLEGTELTFHAAEGMTKLPAEVDYWTGGALTALRSEASVLQSRLDSASDRSVEELSALAQEAGELTTRADHLMFCTREAIVASQMRNNIGQVIESALQGAGWNVIESCYAGEGVDGRGYTNALHMKLRHQNGDEMVSIVMPEAQTSGTISNLLRLSFHPQANADAGHNEREATRIAGLLRKAGLDTGEMECAPGTECNAVGRPENLELARAANQRQPQTLVRGK